MTIGFGLTTKTTPEGTLSYTYDAAGHVETIASSNPNGASVGSTTSHCSSVSSQRPAMAIRRDALSNSSFAEFQPQNVYEMGSSWSERHVGYVAGLGTFGLHKSLITEKGSAGRLGSLITTLELTPTVRPYKGKNDYCPYFVNGSCVACMDRCPAHAVNKTGGDQVTLCSKYTKEVVGPSIAPTPYKNGCGKCLTAAPCEIGIPAGIKRLA